MSLEVSLHDENQGVQGPYITGAAPGSGKLLLFFTIPTKI